MCDNREELYNADEFLSTVKWEDNESADLYLKEEVVMAASNAGLEYLSIVQSKAIPVMMAGDPPLVGSRGVDCR